MIKSSWKHRSSVRAFEPDFKQSLLQDSLDHTGKCRTMRAGEIKIVKWVKSHKCCDISGDTAKAPLPLYLQLCGKPSPPDQMLFTDTWYRENDLYMLHATLVCDLHRRLSRSRRRAARALINLFKAYSQLSGKPLLNVTRTTFVPHLVTMDAHQDPVWRITMPMVLG